jgi:hypothetical protein
MIDNFEKFWLHYLHEHAHPETRQLHIAGTAVGLALAAAALVTFATPPERRVVSPFALLGMAAVSGYGSAWLAHIFIEHNRPTKFPLWSLAADLRMAWLWVIGRLDTELRVAGVKTEIEDAGSRFARR